MSRDYFEFKHMRIEQGRCAMKVSTDACIQGAWTPINSEVRDVLDIGTGTGLLSLMLAQREKTLKIDAIELEQSASIQAKKNVAQSKFAQQIQVIQADARNWETCKQYDLIVCNPPFFTNSLKGSDAQRNLARHSETLSQQELAELIKANLKPNAYASILLPIHEQENWEKTALKLNIYTVRRLIVKPFEHSKPNRVVLLCSQTETSKLENDELVIYQAEKVYTSNFANLMRPFYLHL